VSRLRSRLTYANAMSTIAVFVVLGGTATAASIITGKQIKNSSITSTDIKNGSLLASDFKKGQLKRGKTGKSGKTGAAGKNGTSGKNGVNGLRGLQGGPGVVSVANAAGEIVDIPGHPSSTPDPTFTDPGFTFAGPTVSVTTNATQKVISSFSGVLGVSSSETHPAQPGSDVCYQKVAAGTQPIKNGSDFPTAATSTDPGDQTENYTETKIPVGTRSTVTNTVKFVPGAGTWKVGLCVDNFPIDNATDSGGLSDSDWLQGWALVAN
jgi:hypothetical protein